MRSTHLRLLAAALLLGTAACTDAITGTGDPELLAGAFSVPLLGFSDAPSSFEPAGAALGAWLPPSQPQMGRDGLAGPGGHEGPRAGGMMGGGLAGPFLGGGFAHDFGRGLFGDGTRNGSCAFNAASGRAECAPVTHNGITVTRSVSFKTAAGVAQNAFDSVATDVINTRVAVAGTATHRNGAATAVAHAADRTVAGLAKGSPRRTINGTSAGRETTTGTDSTGAFSVLRVMGDTTKAVVIPVVDGKLAVPASGTVIRAMQVTVSRPGKSPTTSSRREVVTFDGSGNAKVTVTKDGETTSCTIALAHRKGPPRCG